MPPVPPARPFVEGEKPGGRLLASAAGDASDCGSAAGGDLPAICPVGLRIADSIWSPPVHLAAASGAGIVLGVDPVALVSAPIGGGGGAFSAAAARGALCFSGASFLAAAFSDSNIFLSDIPGGSRFFRMMRFTYCAFVSPAWR
jgi:hypothetical protein